MICLLDRLGCGADLGLEGSLQRAEGSWVWEQRGHAWHGGGVGWEELGRKEEGRRYKKTQNKIIQSYGTQAQDHSNNPCSMAPLNGNIKLTFECLMKGLSSLGAYLSNWKWKRKELGQTMIYFTKIHHIKALITTYYFAQQKPNQFRIISPGVKQLACPVHGFTKRSDRQFNY